MIQMQANPVFHILPVHRICALLIVLWSSSMYDLLFTLLKLVYRIMYNMSLKCRVLLLLVTL